MVEPARLLEASFGPETLTRSRSRSMPNPRLVLSVSVRDVIESV